MPSPSIYDICDIHERTHIGCSVSTRKVHTFYKTKTLVNCMELLHLGLPTDEVTKSIYGGTTDKCITLCD